MKTSRKEITRLLFDTLWGKYIERVSYAKKYSDLVIKKGGKIVFDHIAFRTLNSHTGEQPEGIRAIKHILNFLDYKPVSEYNFSKKKLKAFHFEHPDELFPKIFVSQLEVSKLPGWAQTAINKTVKNTPYLLSDRSIGLLRSLEENGDLPVEAAEYLIKDLVQYFRRPWNIPQKDDVLKINDVTQYGAWVLLHGNSVNHFAAYINYQNVKEWPDLETTCKGLANSGIPMKEEIEGERGSKLRQSATQAVKEEVKVKTDGGIEKITWTSAYLELTERNHFTENGTTKLFTGFLGAQATHLFDMTQTHDN